MQNKEKAQNIHSDWPVDELESVTTCPVCDSGVRSQLYKGLSDRVFFSAPGEWDKYRCEFCGGVANGYRNWRYGTRQRPANPMGLLAVLVLPNNRAVIDAKMRHLPKPKRGQRLLGLGCGNASCLCAVGCCL